MNQYDFKVAEKISHCIAFECLLKKACLDWKFIWMLYILVCEMFWDGCFMFRII